MCLAKAYIGETDRNDFIMEDVARLRIEGTTLHLISLFGERKEIEGTLKEVDFQNARIVIEPA